MALITVTQLNQYLGQPIKDICTNGYTNPSDNHCAHFISHVLSYGFGVTCQTMGSGNNPGANIRVQEVFARCPEVGKWANLPSGLTTCLVFVTQESNVDIPHKKMENVPKKHVGIFLNGKIWHYSNAQSKVITQTPEDYSHHYPGAGFTLFYGTFPR